MTFKTAFAALALIFTPVLASAMCSDSHQAMSCADGMVWDSEAGTCVKQVSS